VLNTDEVRLPQLIQSVPNDSEEYKLACQVYNHELFFISLSPRPEETTPTGLLRATIDNSFGSYDAFLEKYKEAVLNVWGSGWVFVVVKNNPQFSSWSLEIVPTENHITPLNTKRETATTLQIPIACIDVWEHAYYTQFKSDRAKFFDNCMKVYDWQKIRLLYNAATRLSYDYTKPFEM
jgi:Fe-Mn family superoxide dismutase